MGIKKTTICVKITHRQFVSDWLVFVYHDGHALQCHNKFRTPTQFGSGVHLPVFTENAWVVAFEHEGEQEFLSGQDDTGPCVEVEALL